MRSSHIAWLNIVRSPVAAFSGIVALSLALGLGGWMAGYYRALYGSLDRVTPGVDTIMGPKSDGLSIFLDGMFFAGQNQDIFDYIVIDTMRDQLGLRHIIPMAQFGVYRGAPVVATEDSFLERPPEMAPPEIAAGRWFRPQTREAVLGAGAARRAGLRVGDRFRAETTPVEGETPELEVVGVLASSGLPHDRAIFVGMEHAWNCHTRAIEAGRIRRVKGNRGATAFLIALDPRHPYQAANLYQLIQINSTPQLVEVEAEVARLRRILGQGGKGIGAIAGLLAVLALASALLLFTERGEVLRRQLGLFRALGYSRDQVARIVLWESFYIAAAGIALGLVLTRALTAATGWFWTPPWLVLPPAFDGVTAGLCAAIALGTVASSGLTLLRLYRSNPHDALKGL